MEFTLTLPDARLHGDARGTGADFAFLHGFGGSLATWDRLWAELPGNANLLRHDMRGFGRSTGEEGSAFSHADDLLALLDARGIERADLCGVSLGGATALNVALDHPQRVRRLVLVSPAVAGWEWSQGWRDHWKASAKAARAGDLATARELWWQHPLFETTRASDAAAQLRQSIDDFDGIAWWRSDERPAGPDAPRLSSLGAPTLLLTGTRDFEDFREVGATIAAEAPQVTRIDIAGAGHMLHMERPGEAAAAIADFFARHP